MYFLGYVYIFYVPSVINKHFIFKFRSQRSDTESGIVILSVFYGKDNLSASVSPVCSSS